MQKNKSEVSEEFSKILLSKEKCTLLNCRLLKNSHKDRLNECKPRYIFMNANAEEESLQF